jgi:flagellar biosynthetic protein FliS
MDNRLRHFYTETRVKNASPGELLVILYDDLVSSAEIAETEFAAPAGSVERGQVAYTIARCINLITELTAALRPEHDPQLCANLQGLYRFFAQQFSEALAKSDGTKVGAILPLLRKLRSAWTQAQKTASREQFVAA